MVCSLCQFANPAQSQRCRACGAPLGASESEKSATPDALPVGALLIGTYAVESVLGQGGFGITYRAHDQMLDRRVAVKEFFPAGCRRQGSDVGASRGQTESDYREARGQFLAEARTLARCHHPGIVSVYTAFEANQTAYMVMELLHGQSLAQLLSARGGRLSEADAVGFIERVGAALSFVHEQDLLHRDIKPDNIMVCDDGRVMLIDFGTAREAAKGQAQNHTVVVTPGYAPLEQYAKQARRGAFTDIYSLAATLYHLLCGQMPPAASDRAMGVALRPVRELSPQASASVARAVELGLQMEIARRPQSVIEFLSALKMPADEAELEGLFSPRPKHDWNEGLDALGGSNAVKPPPVPPRRADEADALGGSHPGSPSAARLADVSNPSRAQRLLLEGFLPGEEPLNEPPPTATRPVKIAPQTPAPSTNPLPPPTPLSTSASRATPHRLRGGTGVAVRKPQPSDGSAAFTWVLFIILVGVFALASLLGSSSSRRNQPQFTNSPPQSSPSAVRSPSNEDSPEEINRKKDAALREWSALPLLFPVSTETLPSTKGKSSRGVADSAFFGSKIEFSPDGKRLGYIDSSSTLRVVSLPTRKVVRVLKLDPKSTPYNMIFSPNNKMLAMTQVEFSEANVGGRSSARVYAWNLSTGKSLGVLDIDDKEDVWPKAIRNDGKVLLARRYQSQSDSSISKFSLWNPKTSTTSSMSSFSTQGGQISYSVQSPDGKELAVGNQSNNLRWFDLDTGKRQESYSGNRTKSQYRARFGEDASNYYNQNQGNWLAVRGINYSLNGEWLASRDDAEITVFNSDKRKVGALTINAKESMFFSISPDGKLVAASGALPYGPQGNLLWNVKTDKKIRLSAPFDKMLDWGFSQDGKQLYGIFADGDKFQFVTWQTDATPVAGFALKNRTMFSAPSQGPLSSEDVVTVSKTGQLLAVPSRSGIDIRKPRNRLFDTLHIGASDPKIIQFSPDESTLAVVKSEEGGTAELWSLKDEPRRVASFKLGTQISALTFSPDSKSLVCASSNGILKWYDIEAKQQQKRIDVERPVAALAFTKKELLVFNSNSTAFYSLPPSSNAEPRILSQKEASGQKEKAETPKEQWAVSEDGKLLVKSALGTKVEIWDLAQGLLLQSFEPSVYGDSSERSMVHGVSISSDGTKIYVVAGAPNSSQKSLMALKRNETE